MPYLGNTPSTSFATVVKDAFSGDGSTVAFTLSKVATTNSVSVFVENVRQEPTTAYAVSGTTLTFTAAPVTSSGNNIYVLHMNPTTTTTHPAAQALTATTGTFTSTVDVNGNELILDADADTSITADTDDQIDIKIAGADDFQFTANTFTAQSGSTIAAQALTATTITATGDISFNGGDFVFNEAGASKDFRVEGDTNANLLLVDGSADRVGINTSSPDAKLDIEGTTDAELRITRSTASASGTFNDQGAVLNLHNDVGYENGYNGGASIGQIIFSSDDASTGQGVRAKIGCTATTYYHAETLDFYVSPSNTTSDQVSATSNSTSKHMSIFGDGSVKFPSLQNLELTALNKAPHIKTTDQLTQLADDGFITVSNSGEPFQGIIVVTNYNLGVSALFLHEFASSTTTLVSGTDAQWRNSDQDGYVCVYTAVNSYDVYVKNRQGSARDIKILLLGTYQ